MVFFNIQKIEAHIKNRTISKEQFLIYSFFIIGSYSSSSLFGITNNITPEIRHIANILSLIPIVVTIIKYVYCYKIIKEKDINIFLYAVIPLTFVIRFKFFLFVFLPLTIINMFCIRHWELDQNIFNVLNNQIIVIVMNIAIAIYFIKILKRIYRNNIDKHFCDEIENREKEESIGTNIFSKNLEPEYSKDIENETPVQEKEIKSVARERHVFATIYMYLSLAFNIHFGLSLLLTGTRFIVDSSIIVYTIIKIIITIVAIFGIISLLKWKKYGFWIYISAKISVIIVSIIISFGLGTNIVAFLNIVEATLMWAVLSLKKNEKTAWDQLIGK